MSTSTDAGKDPPHDPEEATRWFNQWHVYRSIVDADWMCHRGIFAAIRGWVVRRYPGPFTLLDLGCGDAGFIKSTFDESGLWAYAGVDASQAALAHARDELAGARFRVRLVESDMMAYLAGGSAAAATAFDVLLASYAVHHLPAREKSEFFRLAHAALAPRGTLLFADVFRRDGETREEYLAAYVAMMRLSWLGLSPDALAGTIQHVTQRDFPETGEAAGEMARDAGFLREPQELFRDVTGFHRLLAFAKQPVP